jgi:hypothetical protein
VPAAVVTLDRSDPGLRLSLITTRGLQACTPAEGSSVSDLETSVGVTVPKDTVLAFPTGAKVLVRWSATRREFWSQEGTTGGFHLSPVRETQPVNEKPIDAAL